MSNQSTHLVSLQTILEKKEHASGTLSETSQILTGNRPTVDHDTKVLINMIFARFHHIYTHRFESAYGDETTLNQAKREWAMSLAGMTEVQLEFALERCKREHAWPPTIAEFLKLLQPTPESLGLPSLDQAYLEASVNAHHPQAHRWSHVCVQLAAQQVSYHALRSEAERITKPVFKNAYEKLCQRLFNGETVELPRANTLPEPDYSDERNFVDALTKIGVDAVQAQALAYYLEKPKGSIVRERYRKKTIAQLQEMKVNINAPE
ncbi:replication protein P [Reinekea marina]|nr:replication protein P [Reinekea marina]MDN3650628.1 replication protein P [Reinekea marina]